MDQGNSRTHATFGSTTAISMALAEQLVITDGITLHVLEAARRPLGHQRALPLREDLFVTYIADGECPAFQNPRAAVALAGYRGNLTRQARRLLSKGRVRRALEEAFTANGCADASAASSLWQATLKAQSTRRQKSAIGMAVGDEITLADETTTRVRKMSRPERPPTLKEQLLARHFYDPASPAFGNATEAAARAGYRGPRSQLAVQGHRTLRKANVRALQQAFTQHGCTPKAVARALSAALRAEKGKAALVPSGGGKWTYSKREPDHAIRLRAAQMIVRVQQANGS